MVPSDRRHIVLVCVFLDWSGRALNGLLKNCHLRRKESQFIPQVIPHEFGNFSVGKQGEALNQHAAYAEAANYLFVELGGLSEFAVSFD